MYVCTVRVDGLDGWMGGWVDGMYRHRPIPYILPVIILDRLLPFLESSVGFFLRHVSSPIIIVSSPLAPDHPHRHHAQHSLAASPCSRSSMAHPLSLRLEDGLVDGDWCS
jgi:hypothetical protein